MGERTCMVEGCERRHHARGYCVNHYHSWKTTSTIGDDGARRPVCSVSRCLRPAYGDRLCSAHYQQVRKHGRILEVTQRSSVQDRLFAKVQYLENGCIEWRGRWRIGLRREYGAIRASGQMQLVHRVAYELLVGKVPDGTELDHLCRNTLCISPSHLEPVTHRLNVLRGISPPAQNAARTHCVEGHPFDAANTIARSDGGRRCRACKNRRRRERRVYMRGEKDG